MRYASGKYALGRCARCGDKAAYRDLVSDGQHPGMRVHAWCRDEKHPTEKPFRTDDATGLRNPAPDIDDDSAGEGDQLQETFDSDITYFGGGT